MEAKAKLTFVIPEVLQREYRERIMKDGYDMKGKSRWISEAIESLLLMKNYPELVNLSHQMRRFEKSESVIVTKDLKRLLDEAIVHIRLSYPTLEGVQSGIVRTAIVQRIIQSD